MRSFSVIFVLLLSVVSSLPAFAKVDTICSLILNQSAGFFNESKATMTKAPLLANDGQAITGPYTRVHYRKDSKGELLRFAVIGPDDYSAELEAELKSMGYFGIAIRNPDLQTVGDDKFKDFVFLPEWVRTVMPNPKSEEGWLDAIREMSGPDSRGKMARKLAKSKDIRYEAADLNWEDYEKWYHELYMPEIMGKKDGAIPVWNPAKVQAGLVLDKNFDPNKPYKDQKVPGLKRIFFYDQHNRLLGGSLLAFGDDGLVRIRAAAWSANARADLELATRGFKVAVDLATAEGKTHMSYGDDMGIAGIDGTVGLIQFKASLGMRIVPSALIPDTQLLKIFPEKLGEELRAYDKDGKPKQYLGINLYGIPGDIPDRLERVRLFMQANDASLSYEQRAEMTAKSLMAIQVGADKDAPPLSVAKGIEARRLDILPVEAKPEPVAAAPAAPANPNVVLSDDSGVATRKMCDGASQVAKPLSQLHKYLQNQPGAQNRADRSKTNEQFMQLMMALQEKGIKGQAIAALNQGDQNKPEDLLAGIKQTLGIQ